MAKNKDKKKVGHPRNFKTPEILMKAWEDYKAYVDANPYVEEVVTVKGDIVKKKIPNPYLKQGFEAFCFRQGYGSVRQYLDNQDGDYTEYLEVISCIRTEWQENQFSGALTGKYKAASLIGNLNNVAQNINQKTASAIEIKGISDKDLHDGLED